jgi:hypothetical protein
VSRTPVQQRSWLAVRWRQARNPPPPVLRAVLVNLGLASLGGALLLAWDVLAPAGRELTSALVAVYIVADLATGSWLTYRWVTLPSGSGGSPRRSWWAALLGLFAGIPILYLVLVIAFQVVRPLVG